jgi:hypothetical protein
MKKVIIGLVVLLGSVGVNPVHADEGKTLYCQGMVCSETPPAPESVAGFAVVDNSGVVHGIISCNIQSCPKTLEGEYMGCTNCSLVQQTPGNKDGNAYGYISNKDVEVKLSTDANNKNTWSVTNKDAELPVFVNGVLDTVTVTSTTTYSELIQPETELDFNRLFFGTLFDLDFTSFATWLNLFLKNLFFNWAPGQ